ncbi:hypothetical protein HQN89_33720 [Paenibacillus frigoriresistens]|uniref:hypothetical protein n=1 Tax=Paenibacillus alginolyticus TaxID=59839 RepID=UPI001565D663|nr:hypothetical protein [Paenibacillus frigoriresistens]NRF95788.1 hypothetical protein [Paenibacillus frigoriresistens]
MIAFECHECKRQFDSEHDVSLYFDQDTNNGFQVCHDCLIVAARHRRWMMKAQMQLKTRAIALKRGWQQQ